MPALPEILLLGTRGVPASHGGFEFFLERFAPYLHSRGYRVTVFCQDDSGRSVRETDWKGVRLVHVPAFLPGTAGTIVFDFLSTLIACKRRGVAVVFGYNTAIFSAAYKVLRIPSAMNMDGFEWKRRKWSGIAKAWFRFNERLGCLFSDHLIADHPRIEEYFRTVAPRSRISMIPYGADRVERPDPRHLERLGLNGSAYSLVIARPEPENSILEIVSVFSERERSARLVVLGKYDRKNSYQRRVLDAAGPHVLFPGAIYEKAVVESLRHYASLYIHGHTVGGTNPSLVEALASGSPILAHDNEFNRWVAGDEAQYFSYDSLSTKLDSVLNDSGLQLRMRDASKRRFESAFLWDDILSQYEQVVRSLHGIPSRESLAPASKVVGQSATMDVPFSAEVPHNTDPLSLPRAAKPASVQARARRSGGSR